MYKTIVGAYKAGVIKATEPIDISESARILITIFDEKGKAAEDLIEKELRSLSPAELAKLAKERARKLKELGVTGEMAALNIIEIMNEIRQDAIRRGIAIEDESEAVLGD